MYFWELIKEIIDKDVPAQCIQEHVYLVSQR